MLIYGFGTKSLRWDVMIEDQKKYIECTYRYFSLFFVPWTVKTTWKLLGEKRDDEKVISYDEVKKLIPVNTPKLGWFRRAGLPIIVGGFLGLCLILLIIAVIIGSIVGPSSNSQSDKQARTNTEIINSRIFTDAEAKQVAKTASDAEFEQFVKKYKNADKTLEIISTRTMYQNFPTVDEQYQKEGEKMKDKLKKTSLTLNDYYRFSQKALKEGGKDAKTSQVTFNAKVGESVVKLRVDYTVSDKKQDVVQKFYVIE